jgi:hypothetical protein
LEAVKCLAADAEYFVAGFVTPALLASNDQVVIWHLKPGIKPAVLEKDAKE